VIGNRRTALAGATAAGRALGYTVHVIDEPTIGEARAAAPRFLDRARRFTTQSAGRVCVLAAGETTVRVIGAGKGGRNLEFAAAAIDALHATEPSDACVLLSAGTDGQDGPTPAAGAVVDSTTLDRARAARLDVRRALDENDSYPLFHALDDLVVTGPTGTNVGDLQILLKA
jgi:glycerate-2-kinase